MPSPLQFSLVSNQRVLWFPALALVFVQLLLLTSSARTDDGRYGLKRLQPYQRRCYKVTPCILFANEQGSFGCAQCELFSREGTLVEFVSREELNTFINAGGPERVVMIPEFLFFEQSVLSALESASNIAALVVYPGDSPNNLNAQGDSFNNQNPSLAYPPLDAVSEEYVEPNVGHNYYPNIVGPDAQVGDYSDPLQIIEVIQSEETSSPGSIRNFFGTGLKFRLYKYNIFHIAEETAAEIRTSAGNTDTLLSHSVLANSPSSIHPRFKLESNGQMYACPSPTVSGVATLSPSPSPTSAVFSPSTMPSESRVLSRQESDDIDGWSGATSAKCLEEHTCLPIGSQSLWSALGRMNPRVDNNGGFSDSSNPPILAITAPLDSSAFFPELALGASAEIASLGVLLAVAEAVGQYWRETMDYTTDLKYQPVYFALNGQSWGWTGSSRLLKDLNEFTCTKVQDDGPGCEDPFMYSLKFYDLKDWIKKVINIGQMISPNAVRNFEFTTEQTKKFFLASFKEKSDESDLRSVFNEQHEYDLEQSNTNITLDDSTNALPPLDASQSFKRYYDQFDDKDFDIISISNFNTRFTNRYFHSIFDNWNLTTMPENYRQNLYQSARLIAKVVIRIVFGVSPENVSPVDINSETIDGIILCLTANWTECELRETYLPGSGDKDASKMVLGNYAGSFFPSTRLSDTSPTWAVKLGLVENFFAFHNRYEVEDTESLSCDVIDDCNTISDSVNNNIKKQTDWHKLFCVNKQCVLSDTHKHDAFGSAIRAKNEYRSEFEYEADDPAKEPPGGAWTESAWDDELGLCGYVEDTTLYGILILLVGIIIFAVSLCLVLWLDRALFRKVPSNESGTALTREPMPP